MESEIIKRVDEYIEQITIFADTEPVLFIIFAGVFAVLLVILLRIMFTPRKVIHIHHYKKE
jgi:hypothetical protein